MEIQPVKSYAFGLWGSLATLWPLLCIIVCVVYSQTLTTIAYKLETANVLAPLWYVQPAIVFFADMLFFNYYYNYIQLLGAGIILTFMIFPAIWNK